MNLQQVTVSLPEDLAQYVKTAPDASSLVADAIHHYREQELGRELAHAYQEDAEESRRLHLEWTAADADAPE